MRHFTIIYQKVPGRIFRKIKASLFVNRQILWWRLADFEDLALGKCLVGQLIFTQSEEKTETKVRGWDNFLRTCTILDHASKEKENCLYDEFAPGRTRPTLSQFQSFNICRSTFLSFLKLVDWQIVKVYHSKGSAGKIAWKFSPLLSKPDRIG